MTDKELKDIIDYLLFKTGSSKINVWRPVHIKNGENLAVIEASINNKGFIHIRKPRRRVAIKEDGSTIIEYIAYRFTNKGELKDNGVYDDIMPSMKDILRFDVDKDFSTYIKVNKSCISQNT